MTLAVRCRACGTCMRIPARTSTMAVSHEEVAVRLDVEREDLVMVRLFAEAHRGPFG